MNTIDRVKGIIAKPMPEYWYSKRANMIKDEDDPETAYKKSTNLRIAAANKPYFMTYIYPDLKKSTRDYVKSNENGVILRFMEYGIESIQELREYEPKTEAMKSYLEYYDRFMPVGNRPCTVNRICWLFEKEFDGYLKNSKQSNDFDPQRLKNSAEYSQRSYIEILRLYREYQKNMESLLKTFNTEKVDSFDRNQRKEALIKSFKLQCAEACPNEKELSNIVVDICYSSDRSKQFAWDICGEMMLQNLLENNDMTVRYPEKVSEDGDFKYRGESFKMKEQVVAIEK